MSGSQTLACPSDQNTRLDHTLRCNPRAASERQRQIPNVKIAQRSAHRDRLRGAICASQIKTARSSDAAIRCRSRASRRRGHVHHRQVVNDNLSSWGQPSSWRHRAVVISHLRSLRERSWSLGRQVFHGCVDLGLDIQNRKDIRRWPRGMMENGGGRVASPSKDNDTQVPRYACHKVTPLGH